MGWTYTHRDRGTSNQDFFQSWWGPDNCRILDCATVRGTFYAVCESSRLPGKRFAVICLTRWTPRDRYNFGWKDMDETMGPYEARCPVRLLDLLTPTDNKGANDWRERCRRTAEGSRLLAGLKEGARIRLDIPARFGGVDVREVVKVHYRGRRNIYRAESVGLVRLPNILDYGPSVIG